MTTSSPLQLVRSGRVWKFGDQINTDLIMPAKVFRLPRAEQHKMAFESIRPGWVSQVRPGDMIVGGQNFGMGSSRPIGAVLRTCGIIGIVAEAVNGMCLRNCLNEDIPAIDCPGVGAIFEEGDTARIDFLSGRVENLTRHRTAMGKPLPPALAEIVAAGGIIKMLVKDGYIEHTPFTVASG